MLMMSDKWAAHAASNLNEGWSSKYVQQIQQLHGTDNLT